MSARGRDWREREGSERKEECVCVRERERDFG